MANNEYINKVEFENEILIDLSEDTVTEDTLITGYTAHSRSGATITGTLSDATQSAHGLMSVEDKIKLDSMNVSKSITEEQSIIHFEDGADGMPMEVEVAIEPVQSGTGDPSPENIRPITGRIGCNVYNAFNDFYDSTGTEANTSSTRVDINSKSSITVTTTASKAYGASEQLLSRYNLINGHTYCVSAKLSSASGNCSPRFAIRNRSNTVIKSASIPSIGETNRFVFTYNSSTDYILSFFCTWSTIAKASCTYSEIEFMNVDVCAVTFPDPPATVYGGSMKVDKDGTGILTVTDANIESYDGETLPGAWISDRDVYAEGTTPTTGAQVVYKLAEPVEYELTASQVGQIKSLYGMNNVWANIGNIKQLKYYTPDTSTYISALKVDNNIITSTNGIATLPYDVQINNTSIMSNGVANIPIATANDFSGYRLIKVNYSNGINIASDNCLSIVRAIESDAKAGNNGYRVCTPYWKHCYTFYGLAKAAGDSTQSASSNAVGVYTDSAKTAIQNMLGITTMTGATSSVAGTSGLVPAPTTTDVDKFLAGDGTYKSGGLPMVILSYGTSTWQDFINAYNNNVIVYCRASSNSNPATGSQTRMAFMAYVSDTSSPTNVEFQYYRSMNSHSATAMGDEVYVYKLTNASGGTWSVTTRPASIKEIKMATDSAGSVSWSSNVVTLDSGLPAVTASDNGKILKVVDGAWAVVDQ